MKNKMSLGSAISLYIDEHPTMAIFSITILLTLFTASFFHPATRAISVWIFILFILYILGHSVYHIFLNKTKR